MLNKLLWVFPDVGSRDHYMVKRIAKRAGVTELNIPSAVLGDPDFWQRVYTADVVVAFGDDTCAAFTGEANVMRYFGRWRELIHSGHSTHVVFAINPYRLLPRHNDEVEDDDEDRPRGKKFKREQALRAPLRYIGIEAQIIANACGACVRPKEETTHYLVDPSVLGFGEWVRRAIAFLPRFLSWDIETQMRLKATDEEDEESDQSIVEGAILRISFAYRGPDGSIESVSIPWERDYFDSIKALFALKNTFHVGWNNWHFDIPVLAANGFPIGGKVLDGMDLWHWMQSDMDKGLEFAAGLYTSLAPWKHLSNAEPGLYSCIDADAALRIVESFVADMTADEFNTYYLTCQRCMEALRHAGQNGNLIDEEARQVLRTELNALLLSRLQEVQSLVPEELLRRRLYVREPKDKPGTWVETTTAANLRVCSACGKTNVNVKHPCLKTGASLTNQTISIPAWYCSDPAASELSDFQDWLNTNGFNPNSADQVKLYMKHFKHPVGQHHKTNAETADAKHLRKLNRLYGKDHPIYAKILDIHKISKALSTYVEGLAPGPDGKVHAIYTNNPSTLRLACHSINVQNQSKRATNPYAKRSRALFIAPTGYSLVQADSSSIEAVMTGHIMGDETYIALAKQSIHAYLVCKKMGWDWPGDKAKAKSSSFYDPMKMCVHATTYGMGPHLLWDTFPDLYPTLKIAMDTQKFLYAQLPQLETWQHSVRVQAQREGFLVSPWGHKHYFYDVFTYKMTWDRKIIFGADGRPVVRLGKDAKRAVAYKPQHSAGMFMRENLVRMYDSPWNIYMPANVSVHDGYVLIVPDEMVDSARAYLIELLTRPIPQMGNLRIGCEVEVGKDWLHMDKTDTVVV